MSEDKELHRLLIASLSDLEAAAHQITDVLEPLVLKTMKRMIQDFIVERDWDGAVDGLDDFWFAPKEWRDHEEKQDSHLCQFSFDYIPRDDDLEDFWRLSSLTGAGLSEAALFWSRNYLKKVGAWKKVIDTNPDTIRALREIGFVYDGKNNRNLFRPLRLDAEDLQRGILDETLEEALSPIQKMLETAEQAIPVFEPFVSALRKA